MERLLRTSNPRLQLRLTISANIRLCDGSVWSRSPSWRRSESGLCGAHQAAPNSRTPFIEATLQCLLVVMSNQKWCFDQYAGDGPEIALTRSNLQNNSQHVLYLPFASLRSRTVSCNEDAWLRCLRIQVCAQIKLQRCSPFFPSSLVQRSATTLTDRQHIAMWPQGFIPTSLEATRLSSPARASRSLRLFLYFVRAM